MRSKALEGLEICLDGHRVRSSLRVSRVGAYHVAIETVLPDRGIELHSFYTGHPNLDRSEVAHLELTRNRRTLRSAELSAGEVPVVWARRRCVLDHLARLVDFLAELDYPSVAVDVTDGLLAGAERE